MELVEVVHCALSSRVDGATTCKQSLSLEFLARFVLVTSEPRKLILIQIVPSQVCQNVGVDKGVFGNRVPFGCFGLR